MIWPLLTRKRPFPSLTLFFFYKTLSSKILPGQPPSLPSDKLHHTSHLNHSHLLFQSIKRNHDHYRTRRRHINLVAGTLSRISFRGRHHQHINLNIKPAPRRWSRGHGGRIASTRGTDL
ncbi:hypothetical protein CDV31_010000 [Fusarium ambrosium]|uniref:Uncharacterized protein n=1 Tax=Fusarium ambrosium TaxID=131363 RepID=A0A428TR70_9HYPO|nr:hypothetical protein CDV31_010000 [Fusarium ambrosium]